MKCLKIPDTKISRLGKGEAFNPKGKIFASRTFFSMVPNILPIITVEKSIRLQVLEERGIISIYTADTVF